MLKNDLVSSSSMKTDVSPKSPIRASNQEERCDENEGDVASETGQETTGGNGPRLAVPKIKLGFYDSDGEPEKKNKIKKINDFESELNLADLCKKLSTTEHHDESQPEARRVRDMASLLLESREIMRADFNVVDPIDNRVPDAAIGENRDYNANRNSPGIRIHRSTIVKAEKVKSQIGLKYLYIEKIYDWYIENGTLSKHGGVEGVYNPLQVIRNRKIRHLHHEKINKLAIKSLPLPCNAFSSHHKGKRKWEMVWAVSLDELFGDISWRNSHWGELRNAKGKLWFPSENREASEIRERRKRRRRSRLHDKLFGDMESNKGENHLIHIGKLHQNFSPTINEKHDIDKEKPLTNLVNFNKVHYGRRPSRDTNVSLAISSFSSVGEDEKSILGDNSSYSVLNPKISEIDENQSEISDTQASSRGNISEKQQTKNPNDSKAGSSLTDERIQLPDHALLKTHIQSVSHSHEPEEAENEKNNNPINLNKDGLQSSNEISNYKSQNSEGKIVESGKIQELSNNLLFIHATLSIKLRYLAVTYPHILDAIGKKVINLTDEKIPSICLEMSNIEGNQVAECSLLYSGMLKEARSFINIINEDYSIKVDNLLSSSDRGISELNTSLTAEYNKAEERLDRISNSLAGVRPTSASRGDYTSMKLRETDENQFLYFILENLIVITLRIVWILVNIYKVFSFFIRIIFSIMRFIIGFFI